jgi:FkbM family methyltransferase
MSTGVAADLCDQVIAVEPSPRNFSYLQRNIRRSDVSIHNVGIWEETGEIDLQMGSDTTDDGFLPPDSGLDHSLKIQAYRIDDFISSVRGGRFGGDESETPPQIDFLKVEAEGAEPEVLRGLGKLDIPKIVVLCTAERNGVSPTTEVSNILRVMRILTPYSHSDQSNE